MGPKQQSKGSIMHYGWCEVTRESVDFAAAVHRKNTIFTAVLVLAIATWVSRRPLEPAFAAGSALPELAPSRAAANVLTAALVLSMGFANTRLNPPPESREPKEDRWFVMAPVGSAAYLTYWTLSFVTQYVLWSAVAELACAGYLDGLGAACAWACPPAARLAGPAAGGTAGFARRALAASYYAAPFCQGWALALTLLWLKFNWFEPRWRTAVVGYWRERGVPIARIQWWAHLTALAVPLDLLACKDARLLAAAAMPLAPTCAAAVGGLGCYYMLQTDLLFALNGGRWPYPFLAHLSTAPKQAGLVAGIVAAVCGLCWGCGAAVRALA